MKPFVYLLQTNPGYKEIAKGAFRIGGYSLETAKGEAVSATLLDTFDREVLDSGRLLFQTDSGLLLFNFGDGSFMEQATPESWRFAGDLESGPVESVLNSLSKLRAFLPIGNVRIRRDRSNLLDDETKTTARFTQLVLEKGKKNCLVGSTTYLRGYTTAIGDLEKVLRGVGAEEIVDGWGIIPQLGIKEGYWAVKQRVQLAPDEPAYESAAKIIEAHITTARLNESGLIDDFDTEFLHHYRVNFRKVRSVLSLFKGVFDKEQTAELNIAFADIMKDTNRLRDLDVYLLEKKNYFSLVPEASQEGLEILFAYFKRQRDDEHRLVCETLQSKAYLKRVGKLHKLFVKRKNLRWGGRGDELAYDYGCRLIMKRYKKVCKIARKIDESTPDKTVHSLRISCKKLRYLMEFFTPLFPGGEIKNLIKALKKLQDNLGLFNDYSVQQEFLRLVLSEKLPEFGKNRLAVTESIGALTAMLYQQQMKERKRVMESFRRFDSEKTQTSFRKLFEIKGVD